MHAVCLRNIKNTIIHGKNELPAPTKPLSMLISGRAAAVPSELSKYGGEYISPSKWLEGHPPHRPPPPTNTLPSCTKTALLWYVLGTFRSASVRNVNVWGSQISACTDYVKNCVMHGLNYVIRSMLAIQGPLPAQRGNRGRGQSHKNTNTNTNANSHSLSVMNECIAAFMLST